MCEGLKRIRTRWAVLAGSTMTMVCAPQLALAQNQTLGDIASNIQSQTLGPLSDLFAGAAFLLGVVFAVLGLMKLKAHSNNPNDPNAKLGSAIVMISVGACLIAIPEVLGVGITTMFGDAQQTSIDGQLRSLQ